MNARVLVAYASTHGHTAQIADRIGEGLREHDVSAHVCEIGTPGAHLEPAELDGVPSAFFSVSLTAAEDTDEARASTREMIDQVIDQTGWSPTTTAAFAGAFQFREYNLPTRVLMHLIAKRHEDHVDVHQDIDYTDWAAVDRFAAGFATVALSGAPVS